MEEDISSLVKTDHVFDADEIECKVISMINPDDGGSYCIFAGFSIDSAFNSAVFFLCKTEGLRASNKDFVQTCVIVISYSALTGFAQHVIGIGSGLGKLHFNGVYLNFVVVCEMFV